MKLDGLYKDWETLWTGEERTFTLDGKTYFIKTIQIFKQKDS